MVDNIKHYAMLTFVSCLLLATAFSGFMILLELKFAQRLVVIGGLLFFAFIVWAIHRDDSENDFDVMG